MLFFFFRSPHYEFRKDYLWLSARIDEYCFCVAWHLFLVRRVAANFVLRHLQTIRWPISELVHLCMSSRESSPMPVLCYQKLDPGTREIQLFKSARKILFSVPTLSLVTFPLDKIPPYDAVSYTWGRQDRDKTLYLNNSILKTTRNVNRIANNSATWK
jgi:hypothetical protein